MDHNRAYKLGRAFRLGLAFSLGKQHQQGMAMDRWITIHPFGKGKNADYARIFINDDTGVIETGAGGRFNGKTLKEAFSKESKSSESQQATKTPKAIYVTYPNGIESMLFSIEGEPDKIHDDSGNYYDVKGGLQTAIERAKAIGAKVENYDPDDPFDPNSSPWNRDRKKKAEQQARLPGQREEVDIVKRKRGFDMKDADSVSEKFKDAFNAAIGNANSRRDYEVNGQPAFQKALETLPEGTVFVNGSDTDYYIKENGQWLKRSYDDPDRMTTTDVTEPPSFGDTDINGKWLFGIGGSLKQAEANKKMHQMFGIQKPSNGGEGSKTFSRGQKFYERYAQKYNVDSWDAGIYADKKLLDEASKGNVDFVLGFAKSHNEKKLGYRDLEHYELMAIARKNGQSYRHGLNGIDPSSKAELLKGTIDYLKESNYPQSYIDERIRNFKNDLNHSAKNGFVKNLKAKLYDENGNKRDYSFIGGIEHDDLMNKAVKAKYANDLEKDYASGYLRDDNYFAQLERDVPSESNRLRRKENKLRMELAELMMKRDLVGSERVKGIENAIENKNKEINETYARASDAYKKEVSDLENEVITKAAKTKYTRAVFTDNKYGEERNGYETPSGAQIEKVSSGWRIKVDGRQYYADTITAAKRVVAVCDIFKEKGMSDNNVNQDKWLKSAITRFTGRY